MTTPYPNFETALPGFFFPCAPPALTRARPYVSAPYIRTPFPGTRPLAPSVKTMAPAPTPGYPVATAAAAVPSLGTAKTVGGIGALFLFLTLLPGIGGLIGLFGIVMVGYALYKISRGASDPRIFSNFLYAAVAAVIGLAIGIFVVIAGVLNVIGLDNLASFNANGWNPTPAEGVGMLVAIVGGLLIMWAALFISAIFVKRSADLLADRFGLSIFRTAGLVYLIGAALTVVLVGFLILAVAVLIFAVAFFQLPDNVPTPTPPTPWAAPPGSWPAASPGAPVAAPPPQVPGRAP